MTAKEFNKEVANVNEAANKKISNIEVSAYASPDGGVPPTRQAVTEWRHGWRLRRGRKARCSSCLLYTSFIYTRQSDV